MVNSITGQTVASVPSAAPTLRTTRIQPDLRLACNFDSPGDYCNFYQDDTDNFNWERNNGGTYGTNTGPDFDHTKGDLQGEAIYKTYSTQILKIKLSCFTLSSRSRSGRRVLGEEWNRFAWYCMLPSVLENNSIMLQLVFYGSKDIQAFVFNIWIVCAKVSCCKLNAWHTYLGPARHQVNHFTLLADQLTTINTSFLILLSVITHGQRSEVSVLIVCRYWQCELFSQIHVLM